MNYRFSIVVVIVIIFIVGLIVYFYYPDYLVEFIIISLSCILVAGFTILGYNKSSKDRDQEFQDTDEYYKNREISEETKKLIKSISGGALDLDKTKVNPKDVITFYLTDEMTNASAEDMVEHVLKQWNVNHTDPNNFIYKYNGESINTKNTNMSRLRLYSKCFDKETISCPNMLISSMPEYPNLIHLDCSGNSLQTLPKYPNLTHLDCHGNPLSTLLKYPKLEELNCSDTQIQYLPELQELKELSCSNNNDLWNMPKLVKLIKLVCSVNPKLTSIPSYPNLEELTCSHNENLINLPELPKLIKLVCSDNNKLISIPSYSNLMYLNCMNDLNLTTLGKYPKLVYFKWNGSPLEGMSHPNAYGYPNVSGLPNKSS